VEKPNVEILEAVLREGLYWAYLGRPKEVMAFLRGKLKKIANDSFDSIEEILKELEEFYEEVSRMDTISKKEFKKINLYRDMLLSALEYSD